MFFTKRGLQPNIGVNQTTFFFFFLLGSSHKKEVWFLEDVHQLLCTQQLHDQEQIPITTDPGARQQTVWSSVFYQAGHLLRI